MMKTMHKNSAPGQAGFSLVEGIIAAALLLVIAVSVLPLFTRALESNISGGRSSQISTFASFDIEEDNQGAVDRDDWRIATSATPGVLELRGVAPDFEDYWDSGPIAPNDHLGDEKWVAAPTTRSLWSRRTNIRKYSLGDIQIVIGGGGGLVTSGASPMLFDNPLTTDANAHFTEIRVSINEHRGGDDAPAASGKRITVGHFRSF